MQPLFVGTEPYQLDDRNRVPIPPAYRVAFEAGCYLTEGQAPCIQVFTVESFEKASAIFDALPQESEEADDARRAFFGSARLVQKDAQGRITLKEDLLAYAGLTREVVVVGVRDRLEIWDRAKFAARIPTQAENRRKATARQQNPGGEG